MEQEFNNKLIELISEFTKLKLKKEEVEAELKNLNGILEEKENELFKMMFNLDITSIKVDNMTYYTRIEQFPRIKNKEKFLRWLETNGHASLIKRDVNSNTLKAWFKDIEPEISEELISSNMLSVFEKQKIGIRKTGGYDV